MKRPRHSLRSTRTALVLLVLVGTFALAAAQAASSASTQLINLGPIAVANGTVAFTGTLGQGAAGLSLTANGHPVSVASNGAFAAQLNLEGASTLNLALNGGAGNDQTAFTIPLTGAVAGPNGVIPPGVLDDVQQAGAALLTPIVGSNGLTVQGSVADLSPLSSLKLNGKDVLSTVTGDHTFSTQVPGTTLVLTLAATDSNGVQVIQNRMLTVSAAKAAGVKIVKVRFLTKNVVRRGRVRMVVTVRDRLARMIRGARISVSATRAGFLANRPSTAATGRHGAATVALRLKKAALGKRLVVLVVAKTPSAKARRKSSCKLPAPR